MNTTAMAGVATQTESRLDGLISSVLPGTAKPVVAKQSARSPISTDVFLYLIVSALVWAAWEFSQRGYFEAGDDLGYWIGVTGAVLMLLLFSYPLRKHFKFAHGWGRMKVWLWLHIALGITGPVLILAHSTFRVGSLNAGVALYSMIIVALSGIVGRFIYSRVNRGLYGEQTGLRELETRAGFEQWDTRSKLRFAPAVEQRLKAFADGETSARPALLTCLRRVFWLPAKQWMTYRACRADLHQSIHALARVSGWDDAIVLRRERLARKLVRRYLNSVVRVAQYTAYERLFSLWHVAHIPFVYLLVASAIVHVIAVHAY